jgi:Septum formation
MAAPTGVSSGSAPEPVVPEPPATLESAVPQPSEPAPSENAAASAVPQPSEPGPGENAAAGTIPQPTEPGPGENMAASADTEPTEPALGENTAASADTEPTEPALGENTAASADTEPSEPAADPEHEPLANENVRPGRGVGWLVTAGVVIVVIAAAAAAGALVVATHGFRHKTIVKYRPAAVFALRAGECINSSPNGLSVTILSCSTPHEAEVFATFSLTGSDWPGSAAIQQQASDGCANRIAGYLNPQLSNAGLTQEYVYPNQEAWKADVRTVVCEVSAASGPLSGSVRQGG